MTITIRPDRVLGDLAALTALAPYETGVHRPTLSKEHLASLSWLVDRLRETGQEASIDGIANVIGRDPRPGPKLLAGSHMESQNHAGRLDGPLGIVYALEAARALKEAGHPGAVEVASWCDEEGHFGSFLGSRSALGEVTDDEIDKAVDRTDGRRMRDALAAAGLAGRPRTLIERGRYVGYLEAHIEQGDWLEAGRLRIGIVTSIVGIWQYRLEFAGEQNHAGTTRMAVRKDAGVAAVRVLAEIDRRFPAAAGERSVWTTGRIRLDPGGPSVIPGRADVLFQIRDADTAVLARLDALLAEIIAEVDRGPCRAKATVLRKSTPAVMAPHLQAAFEQAAEARAPGLHVRMPSGAGHDAQTLATRMPSAMLFVPSIGGISHHWSENTADADIVLGAQVFADACAAILSASRA